MTKLIQLKTVCSMLSPSGVAILLLSLGAACGGGVASSAVDGGVSAEGGNTADGGNTTEGGTGLQDARTATDSGDVGDGRGEAARPV